MIFLFTGDTWFGWDPRHLRCWDPIAKTHLKSRFWATSYFENRGAMLQVAICAPSLPHSTLTSRRVATTAPGGTAPTQGCWRRAGGAGATWEDSKASTSGVGDRLISTWARARARGKDRIGTYQININCMVFTTPTTRKQATLDLNHDKAKDGI